MSINMTNNFFKLMLFFREQNLDEFYEEHSRLHAKAQKSGDFVPCTTHYYRLMSKVIDNFFNGNFHFVAPISDASDKCPETATLEDALRALHKRIGRLLKLAPGRNCIDIGCGIGGVMLDLAPTGANITGLTVAPGDIITGNEQLRSRGYDSTCRIVESACHKRIPLDSGSQQAAYAIYALKYFPSLKPVLRETARVLETGGFFAVYDLVKTEAYEPKNADHREIIEGLEFACGMPAIHSRSEMIEEAALVGLRLISAIDIDRESGWPFHYCFSHSPFYMWLMRSSVIQATVGALEWLRVLPAGFARFNRTFLSGTVSRIVTAGEMGILQGGEILLFQKQ